MHNILKEEFEDTKGVMRIRVSKKNRQHNGQKNKYKRTNDDLQNIHIKLKIEYHEPHKKPGWTEVLRKGKQFIRNK
jgi:hypothetical protein